MIHGCEENSPSPTRKAVIEGYLCSGDHPYVMFSASVVPGISGHVADAVVNWGKVNISDGDTTVVLTGRVEESTTPPFV